MREQQSNSGDGPSPEQLAAYADGEADSATRDSVEAWLAEHADASGEVEALQQLARLCRSTPAPEPSAAAWDAVFQQIMVGVFQPAEAVPGRRRSRRLWASGAVLGAAAAVLLAFVLSSLWRHPQSPEKTGRPTEITERGEPFPLAAADDVEIISIEDADIGTLLVGEPPVRGPLTLASASDVTLENVDPAADDGMVPKVHMGEAYPMIVAPVDAGEDARKENP